MLSEGRVVDGNMGDDKAVAVGCLVCALSGVRAGSDVLVSNEVGEGGVGRRRFNF